MSAAGRGKNEAVPVGTVQPAGWRVTPGKASFFTTIAAFSWDFAEFSLSDLWQPGGDRKRL